MGQWKYLFYSEQEKLSIRLQNECSHLQYCFIWLITDGLIEHISSMFVNSTGNVSHKWYWFHVISFWITFCLTDTSVFLSLTLLMCLWVSSIAPLFETQCSYVEASLDQFLCWTSKGTGTEVGLFSGYPLSEYWAYADYKYIAMLFQDQPSMFEVMNLFCLIWTLMYDTSNQQWEHDREVVFSAE